MELKGKALYNSLKMSAVDASSPSHKDWQVEDLRAIDLKELFHKLKDLGISLNEESFCLYADEVESPEELVDCVWLDDENVEGRDRAYLILFELWRRLLPDRQALSIFCDGLDQLIELYDRDALEEEEQLQAALNQLEDILDDACDEEGLAPQNVFQEINKYLAHDLESFIYDYIGDLIENKDEVFASELIDAFCEYVEDKKWFDFLRARLFYYSDSEEANVLIERLLEQLKEEPDAGLLMQVIDSLVHYGDIHLFRLAVKQAVPLLKTEGELQELLTMGAEYYRLLDKEKEEKEVEHLLNQRQKNPPEHPLHASDHTLTHFCDLLGKTK